MALLYELDPAYAAPAQATGRGGSRRSRVQRLEVKPGTIQAQVRDRETGLCNVTVTLPQFSDAQWQTIIDGLAGQAIFAAQMLAGDLPTEIEQVFTRAGVSLLPADETELHVHCSACGAQGRPGDINRQAASLPICLHVEAVFRQMSTMLADDPWLLFQLRGMDRPQILQSLRERRLNDHPQERVLPAPQSVADPENHAFFRLNPDPENIGWLDNRIHALDADMEQFWGDAALLENLTHHLGRPEIELTLLRRLGYPPFASHSMESYDALAQVYRQVTEAVLKLAFGDETDETGEKIKDGGAGPTEGGRIGDEREWEDA